MTVEAAAPARYRGPMGRSKHPRRKVIPPTRVNDEEDTEIRRRAEAADMTLADYVRERALGRECRPIRTVAPADTGLMERKTK